MHHRLIPTLGKAEKMKKRPPNVGKLRKSVKTAFLHPGESQKLMKTTFPHPGESQKLTKTAFPHPGES